ncbi:MAG: hypothetical protein BMS9Abin01_0280 [Gammaproteobacteria bacterium]|nr:MAG: hypothetical protein BMS9Abin01_0280 [Gammaproteobacteria bacterium]
MSEKPVKIGSGRRKAYSLLLAMVLLINVGVAVAWYLDYRAWAELEQRWAAAPRLSTQAP